MDNSSGMQQRTRRSWKMWFGVAVALAVAAGIVVLIALSAGGGSGGIY
ncbi:MAG: hypothetical protein WB297_07405 [Actinomycetota bacterium]